MSDNIVGKISAKVWPDTTGFPEELRAKLTRIRKSLKDIQVPVVADTKAMVASVRTAVREAQSAARDVKIGVEVDQKATTKAVAETRAAMDQAREAMRRAGTLRAEIDVDLKTDSIKDSKQRIREINRELAKLKWNWGANLDTSEFNKLEAKIKKLESERIDLKADLRVDKGVLARARAHIKDELKRSKAQVDIKPELDKSRLASAVAGVKALKVLLQRTVGRLKIPVAIDGASISTILGPLKALSGWRMADSATKGFRTFAQDLDKAVPKIAALSSGMMHFGGSVVGALANLSSLLVSLAQIAPAVLALPGMLVGAGVGLAAFGVGLSDIGKRLPYVGERFKGMGKLIKDGFWKDALKPMDTMFRDMIPKIEAGMGLASRAAGRFTGALASAFKTELNPRLPGFFANVAKGIDTARAGTAGFAKAFGVLMTVGSSFLPRFGAWLSQIGLRFGNWISASERSGAIYQWIDLAIQRIKELGALLYETGRFFGGFFGTIAQVGTTTVGTLASAMGGLADTVQSPAWQKGAIEFFTKLKKVMDASAQVIGIGLKSAFGSLAEIVGAVFEKVINSFSALVMWAGIAMNQPAFKGGMKAAFEGIAAALAALIPIMPTLFNGLGALGRLIGTIGKELGPVLATVIGFIAKKIEILEPYLSDIIRNLAPALIDVLKKVGGPVGDLLNLLGPLAVEMSKVLGAAVRVAGDALKWFLDQVVQRMKPIVGDAIKLLQGLDVEKSLSSLGKAAEGPIGKVLDLLASLVRAVLEIVVETLPKLAPALGPIWGGIGSLAGTLGKLVNPLKEFVKTLLGAVASITTNAAPGLQDGLKALEPIGASLGRLFESLKKFFDSPVMKGVIAFLGSTLGGAISNLGALLGAVVPPIINYISSIVDGITKLFEGDWKGALQSWMGGFSNLLVELSAGFQNFALTFIKNSFKSLADAFKAGGNDSIAGWFQGLTDSVSRIKDKMKEINDSVIKSFKEFWGIHSPSTLMASMGGFIISGLVGGIASMAVNAAGAMGGVGRRLLDAWNNAGGSLKDRMGAVLREGGSIVRERMGDLGRIAWDGASRFAGFIASGGSPALSHMARLGSGLLSSISGYIPGFGTVGHNVMVGLANGIRGAWDLVTNMARSVASGALSTAKRALGIQSPSRVFRDQVGAMIPAGIAVGIDQQASTVLDQLDSLSKEMVKAFDPELVATPEVGDLGSLPTRDLQRRVDASVRNVADVGRTGQLQQVTNINQTINNPVAEPSSTAVNRGQQLAMLL